MTPTPAGPAGFSRRGLIGGALGLALLGGAASACSAPSFAASGRTSLRYWNLFGGGDGVNMQALIAQFQQEHPEIDMEANTLAWGAPPWCWPV